MDIKTENEAREIVAILEKSVYEIKSIEKKEQKKHPLPPFITDTLQRSAYNLLGMSPKRAMMVAQKLYETGNITYMRTDSPNLSKQALDEAANFIKKEYSEKYLIELSSHEYQTSSTSPYTLCNLDPNISGINKYLKIWYYV